MKKIVLVIVLLLCLLEIIVMVVYFKIFDALSFESQDWAIFNQIFNGCIMAVLTGINIWIFYKISNTIEENTKNRATRQTLFEAQLIVTQMRVKKYEELTQLINDIIVDLYQKEIHEDKIERLKKILMRIDVSFLFRNDNLEDIGFLFSLSKDIIDLMNERKEGNAEKLADKLNDFIIAMEMYIFSQMLRGRDVEEYISAHKGDIDSTFNSINQFVNRFNEFVSKSSLN